MVWKCFGRREAIHEAIAELRQRADLVPSQAFEHEVMGLSYAHQGEAEKAVAEWKQRYERDGAPEIAEKIEKAFQSGGMAEVRELRYRMTNEAQKTRYVSQLELAEVAAEANHKAEALGHVEKAYQEREALMVKLLHNPELDPLRREPRFQAIVKKMGLPGAE